MPAPPLPRRSPRSFSPTAPSSSSSSQPFCQQTLDAFHGPSGHVQRDRPLPAYPQPGVVPPWPGASQEDDEDSDDSTDKHLRLASSKKLGAAGGWIAHQAPIFLCGMVVAWLSLLMLWPSDHEALRSEVEASRMLMAEMRHMAELLRNEVREAKQVMGALGDSKAAAAAFAGGGQGHSAAQGHGPGHGGVDTGQRQWASSMHVLPPKSHAGPGVVDLNVFHNATGVEGPAYLETWPIQVLRAIFFFLLDGGLGYFCLKQFISQAAKAHLEALLLRLLSNLGLGSYVAEPGSSSKTAAKQVVAEDAGAYGRMAQVETTAADAFLVRRRDNSELAPVQRLQAMQQAEQLRIFRSSRLSIVLATTSFAGVAGTRLAARLAGFVGWRFLNHVVMYAVLTVRVCLIAFLVLF